MEAFQDFTWGLQTKKNQNGVSFNTESVQQSKNSSTQFRNGNFLLHNLSDKILKIAVLKSTGRDSLSVGPRKILRLSIFYLYFLKQYGLSELALDFIK